jgi:hypothetical protein
VGAPQQTHFLPEPSGFATSKTTLALGRRLLGAVIIPSFSEKSDNSSTSLHFPEVGTSRVATPLSPSY